MPTIARLLIKTALIWLILGLFLGVYLFSSLAGRLAVILLPVFYHMIILGWVTQLIFGVAYWFFPKYSKDHPRGYEKLIWISYFALNSGLILRAIGEPMAALSNSQYSEPILLLSILLQWFAALAFVINTWKRTEK